MLYSWRFVDFLVEDDTLLHEVVHIMQYFRHSHIISFLSRYFAYSVALFLSSFDFDHCYQENPYELEGTE